MKKEAFYLLAFFMAIIGLAGCQTGDETSTTLIASLSELTGTVNLKMANQTEFTPAGKGQTLGVNGQVQTGEDGRVRLDLSSGTIIRVAPSSLFTLTSNDKVEGGLFTKLKLEAGKIFIVLNGGQADVETPSGVASVKGSYLSVEVGDGQITLTCLEGTCSLDDPNGGVIIIPPGNKLILTQNPNTGLWDSPVLGSMSEEDFQEWLDKNPEAKEVVEQGQAAQTESAPTEAATEIVTEATPTKAPTETPTAASASCLQIEQPINGSALNKTGQVDFAWSEQSGASAYVVTFVNADGSRARIETSSTSASFYIEVLPTGGSYQWFVTAYGSDGNEICTSAPASFSKPKGDPTAKPTAEEVEQPEPQPTEDQCSMDPCSSPSCPDYYYYECDFPTPMP